MTKHLPIITVSSARAYRRCSREYFYRYEQGLVSVERAGNLKFGSAVHAGLEHLYTRGWDADAAIDAALASGDADPDPDPFEASKIEVMLRGYAERWRSDCSNWKVLGAESEFRTLLCNPDTGAASKTWSLAGKLDVLVLDGRGQCWIVEHKTTSEAVSPGSPYWEKLRLDSQVSAYYVGARALGYEPVGVIYDVLRKPQLRPLKATPSEARKYTKSGSLYANQRESDETPDEYRQRLIESLAANPQDYYSRAEIVRLEAEEREAAQDVWQQARVIRESQLSQRWPRNPEACERYGRFCDYWSVCTRTADISDPTRFRLERAHAELSKEIAA